MGGGHGRDGYERGVLRKKLILLQVDVSGYLMYSTHCSKVRSWRDLSPTILSELENKHK